MITRSRTLRCGATVYELHLTGPGAEGEIVLAGSWHLAGQSQGPPLPELRGHVEATAEGDLRLTTTAGTERVAISRRGRGVWVSWRGRSAYLEGVAADRRGPTPATSPDDVRAPMAGVLLEVRAVPGRRVGRDEVLAVLEAMKMEYRITAPREGEVAEVTAQPGERVELGSVIVRLAPDAEAPEPGPGNSAEPPPLGPAGDRGPV